MSDSEINRRELIVTAAGAGAAATLVAFCSMLRNADRLDPPPAFFISEG